MQAAQFIARDHGAIGPRRIHRHAQRIDIGHRLDRHDMFAAHAIDQDVARGAEDEGLGVFRPLGARRLADPHIDLLPEIGDIGLVAPIVLQELHERRLQRQDFMREPFPQFGRVHDRAQTAPARIPTMVFRYPGHPSPQRLP